MLAGMGRAPMGTAPGSVVEAVYKLHIERMANGTYNIPYRIWAARWWAINVNPDAKRANRWRDSENVRQMRPHGSRESQWVDEKSVPIEPMDDRPMIIDFGFMS